MGQRYLSQNLHRPLLKQTDVALSFDTDAATTAEAQLSADSRQFLAAWKTWRGDRLLPQRRDMDLVSIARLMPKLALLEAFGPQRMVFRLAGSDIETLVGMRLMGRDHIALAAPDQRAQRSRFLWAAATQPCAAVSFHQYPQLAEGRGHQSEILTLPILPDEAGAPIQLLSLASHLPVLENGTTTRLPLERIGATQLFIDIGAGIPAERPITAV